MNHVKTSVCLCAFISVFFYPIFNSVQKKMFEASWVCDNSFKVDVFSLNSIKEELDIVG